LLDEQQIARLRADRSQAACVHIPEKLMGSNSLHITEKSTDVFVVGGGPAGLATAISLQRAGMKVIVADAAKPAVKA